MEILKQEIGKEAFVTVELSEGKIVIKSELNSSGLGAGVMATIETDYFLDKIAEKIPGQIDDAVLAVFKSALKAIS